MKILLTPIRLAILALLSSSLTQAGIISVSEPTGIFVGGVSTALGTYVSSMPSGTWSPRSDAGGGFSISTLTNAMVTGSDVGPIWEYAANGFWDAANKKLNYEGGTHDNLHFNNHIVYDDATNTWSSVTPPWSLGPNSIHSVYGEAGNPATGDFFLNEISTANHWTYKVGGAWTQAADNSLSPMGFVKFAYNWNVACGCLFSTGDPPSNGGQPGVSKYTYTAGSPAGGTWTNIATNVPWNQGWGYYYGAFYDPVTQATFFASSHTNSQMVKVTSAGVVSTVSVTIPSTIGVSSSDNNAAIMVNGYTTPGSVQRKPMLIKPGTGMWEFDGNALTFTSLGITPPNWQTIADYGFFEPVSTYDMIWFFTNTGTSGALVPQSYIYRR